MTNYGSTAISPMKHLPALLLMLIFCKPVSAQFFDVKLEIDAQMETITRRNLDFGTLTINSGRKLIELGSKNMGVISIAGMEGQQLFISVNKPTYLKQENPAGNDKIPVSLFMRYGHDNQASAGSKPIHKKSLLRIAQNSDADPWNNIYLFLYGAIKVGNVSQGNYSADMVLNIQYI